MPAIPPAHVQTLALGCAELHQTSGGPPFESLEIPLNGIPSFHCVNSTTQLAVISKRAEGALNSVSDVIDKDVKEHWSQDSPLGDTALYWPSPGHRTVNHHPPTAAFQPIPCPLGDPPIKATSLQSGHKEVAGPCQRPCTNGGAADLHAELRMGPHKGRAEEHNRFPHPARHFILNK